MNYIKLYFGTHLKYWWAYLISICILIFAYTIGMFCFAILSSMGMLDITAWVIGIIIGGLIFSSPLIFVNHKIALIYAASNDIKINIYILTIFNQFISFIISTTIYIMILYSQYYLFS